MPAMHEEVHNCMLFKLEEKLELMVRLIPFSMTHEECIRLVAPAEHVEILTNASKYADIKSSEAWMTVRVPVGIDGELNPEVQLMMRTHAEKSPPLIPRAPQWQRGYDGRRVILWLQKRFELGRRFGTARHVLRTLNHACETGAQLRYMFPAVLQLCEAGRNPRMDRWMTKHATYRPCKFTPAVSPELKRAIQDSSALLTSAMLIGEDIPERVVGEVDIVCWSMPNFKVDGEWAARM